MQDSKPDTLKALRGAPQASPLPVPKPATASATLRNRGPPNAPNRRRLRIRAVEARTGYHRQSIWRWYRNGTFPKPHYIGTQRVWFEDEIEEWEQSLQSDKPVAIEKTGNR